MPIIYLLTNNINGKLYVGKSIHSLDRRWGNHCAQATRGSTCAIHRAIRKYGPSNFERELISENVPADELDMTEIIWIHTMNSKCPSGYNMTFGGDSGGDPPWDDPEYRRKQTDSQKRRWADPEQRERNLAHYSSPAYRTKVSASICAAHSDPEVKRKMYAANYANPDVQQRRSEGMKARYAAHPEYAQQMSERSKSWWADPAFRKKVSASHKERALRTAKDFSNRMKKLWEDPEFRKQQSIRRSQSAKRLWENPDYRRKILPNLEKGREPFTFST